MPENLEQGATAERLDEVIEACETFVGAIDELEGVELPRGFGRD